MKIAVVAIAAVSVLGVFSLRAQDGAKSVWDGVYTEAQAKRGAAGYAEECAMCHGAQLTGGEMAPPLAGGEFLSNWNGLTAGDLAERIRTTMPSSKPGKLSRKQNADVTAFLFSVNEFPAGDAELSEKVEFQRTIRIEAQKPD